MAEGGPGSGPDGAGTRDGRPVPTGRAAVPFRRHLLHDLFTLEPGRPAYAAGFRMAVIITVPLAVGAALHHIPEATLVCLGALNGGTADTGGAPATRRRAMVAAAVANAVAVGVGTVVGERLGLSVALLFVVGFASGVANLFGNVAANVGFTSSVLFIVGIGLPGHGLDEAVQRLWLALVGGVWALVVTLVVWPVHPFAAAETALARACRSVSAATSQVAAMATGRSAAGDLAADADEARDRLADARTVLTVTRAGSRGHSETASRLLGYLDGASAALVKVEALVTTVDIATTAVGSGPMMETVAEVLDELAGGWSSLADSVEGRGPGPGAALAGAIHRQLDAMDDTLAGRRRAGEYQTVARLRPMVEGLRQLVATVEALVTPDRPTEVGDDDGVREDTSGPAPGRPGHDGTRHRPGPHPVAVPGWRERAAVVRATVRANATLRSSATRHGVRLGATLAVGLLLVHALGLVKGYWVLITIAVVLRPYATAVLPRVLLRTGGTVLGAMVAAVIVAAVERPADLVAVMFVLAVFAFSLFPLNYGLGVTFLTPLIIVLISAGAPGDWELAGDRILDTVLGAALGLVGGYLLWPTAEREDTVDELASAVDADRRLLAAALDRSPSRGPVPRATHEEAGRAVANVQAGFQRLVTEPLTARWRREALWSATEAVRGLYLATTPLESRPTADPDGPGVALVDRVRRSMDGTLTELAAALRQRRPPDDRALARDELGRAVSELYDHAVDLRMQGRLESAGRPGPTPTALAARGLWLVAAASRRLSARVDELVDGVRDLGADGRPGPP